MPVLKEIPRAFVSLHEAGRFDCWGAPYKSLSADERKARMHDRMPAVLWWEGIEWDRSVADVAGFERDDRLRPGLVPFAGNGAGDHYCWYPRWQEGPEPPVVLARHDARESPLFARDFGELLARALLRSFAGSGATGTIAGHAARSLFESHLEIVRPHVASANLARLERVRDAFSAEECSRIDAEVAAEIGRRTLVAYLEPVRYQEKFFDLTGWASGPPGPPGSLPRSESACARSEGASLFDHERLLRAYRQSEAFYQELVAVEGYEDLRPSLAAVRQRLEEVLAGRS